MFWTIQCLSFLSSPSLAWAWWPRLIQMRISVAWPSICKTSRFFIRMRALYLTITWCYTSLTSFVCLALCVPGGAFHLNVWLGKSNNCLAIIKLVSALSSRQFTVRLHCHQDKSSQHYSILSWKHPSSSVGLHEQTVHESFKKYRSYSNVYMHPRLMTAMKIWGTTAKSQLQHAMHPTILNVF